VVSSRFSIWMLHSEWVNSMWAHFGHSLSRQVFSEYWSWMHLPCSNGGVTLISADGRIMCSNTLDDRLKISYSANLPEIRMKLFGAAWTRHQRQVCIRCYC
jgi:vacuolar-type H+-ATPase subunit E/Vma4